MNFWSKKIVGIDFHDYFAQLVELRLSKNNALLESYSRVVIPPSVIVNGEIVKEEELKNILTSLLYGADPKPITTKDIAIVFPSAKVFTHIFSFPSNLKEAEVRKAIPFEAEKIIPFSIEDVYFDFLILEHDRSLRKQQQTFVLFAAIPKKTADKYLNLLEAIGLTPFLFGVDVEALQYGLLKQIESDKHTLIIDVSSLGVNYMVVKGRTVKKFVSSSSGGKHLFDALMKKFKVSEGVLLEQKERASFDKKFYPDIKKFLHANYTMAEEILYECEKDASIGPIPNILLNGEFLNLPDFYQTAVSHFPKKNIATGNPKHCIAIDVDHFQKLEQKDEHFLYATYFTYCIGIALRSLKLRLRDGLNLLPDSLRERFMNKKRVVIVVFFTLFMVMSSLLLASFMLFYHGKIGYERIQLEAKRASVYRLLYGTRYQEIRDATIQFNEEVQELSTIDKSLFSVPIMLADIRALLPDGVTLTGFKYRDSDLSVEIQGIAETRDDLLAAHDALRRAEFVSEVITPISNYDAKYRISFVIKVFLDFKHLPHNGSLLNS